MSLALTCCAFNNISLTRYAPEEYEIFLMRIYAECAPHLPVTEQITKKVRVRQFLP